MGKRRFCGFWHINIADDEGGGEGIELLSFLPFWESAGSKQGFSLLPTAAAASAASTPVSIWSKVGKSKGGGGENKRMFRFLPLVNKGSPVLLYTAVAPILTQDPGFFKKKLSQKTSVLNQLLLSLCVHHSVEGVLFHVCFLLYRVCFSSAVAVFFRPLIFLENRHYYHQKRNQTNLPLLPCLYLFLCGG